MQSKQSTTGVLTFSELGHGAQFKAYDMHNGRVLKIPLTEAETYQVARRRRNVIHGTVEQVASLEVRVQTFMNSKARLPAMLGHGFTNSSHFHTLLGNPKVSDGSEILPDDTHEKKWAPARFVYTQDRVETAAGMLRSVSGRMLTAGDERRLRHYIEDYVQMVYDVWSYGYSDYIFKLGDTGITSTGGMIFVDLGEWTSDLDFIRRAVQGKWWHDNINHDKVDFPKLPQELEQFYIETMDNALTVEELNKRWRVNHTCTDCTDETMTMAAFVAAKVTEIDYIDRL